MLFQRTQDTPSLMDEEVRLNMMIMNTPERVDRIDRFDLCVSVRVHEDKLYPMVVADEILFAHPTVWKNLDRYVELWIDEQSEDEPIRLDMLESKLNGIFRSFLLCCQCRFGDELSDTDEPFVQWGDVSPTIYRQDFD